jgi:RNA ligase
LSKLKEKVYRNLERLPVEQYQKYLEEADKGYIRINKHPEDENIIILNYTELVTFERRWNEQTLTARGLILDVTNATDNDIIVLARPFDKFFNYGENLEYEKDIDFNETPTVMEKLDGSLGISYFFNDEIRFATRGSFISEQAIKATEIWREKYAHRFKMNGWAGYPFTILVEIIYPENRVVVNYKGMEDLVLLGARYISQEEWDELTDRFLEIFCDSLDMPIAKFYDLTLDKILEMKKDISANEEGWILKFSNNKRLKIKGDEYLSVHRAIHGLSLKAKVQAWKDNRMTELIKMIPEEFREEMETLEQELNSHLNTLHTYLDFQYILASATNNKIKEFAMFIQSKHEKPFRSILIEAFKNNRRSVSEQLVKDYIYKNYRYYLGVDE